MFSTRLFYCLSCFMVCSTVAVAQNKTMAFDPGVPDLEVLNRMVGKWTGKLVNSDEQLNAERKWVLNGRFLKHEFSLASGSLSGVIYRGYDKENERYTMTILDSNGSASMLAGYWSEELKTLTFDAIDSSCQVQHYESYFPDDSTEQWKIQIGVNRAEINGVAKKVN